MNIEELRQKYPPGFPVEKIPEGAKEESINVFRICRSGRVETASFLPTYLDELAMTKENDGAEPDIGYYSMSTFFKENEARKKLKFFRGKHPKAILASGCTEPICGLCQRTRERKGKTARSHVDWWLYQEAQPHTYFKEMELESGEENEDSKSIL